MRLVPEFVVKFKLYFSFAVLALFFSYTYSAFAAEPRYSFALNSLPALRYSSVAVVDYNNDGNSDLLMAGKLDGTGAATSVILKNNGNGTFTNINAGLTGLYNSSVIWFDYNNDTKPDALITGTDGASAHTLLYRNDGSDTFTLVMGTGLPDAERGGVAAADYNKDGFPDILIAGGNGTTFARIYRNNGNATFTDISAGLTSTLDGAVAWADIDNDTYLDAFVSGSATARVYRNNNDGTFSFLSSGLTGV